MDYGQKIDRVCEPADEINIGDNLGLYLYYLYKLSLHEKHEGFLIIKISKTNNIFIEKT